MKLIGDIVQVRYMECHGIIIIREKWRNAIVVATRRNSFTVQFLDNHNEFKQLPIQGNDNNRIWK